MTIENGPREPMQRAWTVESAEELYAVRSWGDGFYFVNDAGHAAVRPLLDKDLSIDILEVVQAAAARDVAPPMLVRFQDVLRARVRRLVEAFDAAIADAGYGSPYQAIYPIKVNQLHEVVEEVLDAGKAYGLGLECGSKTELIATLPHIGDDRLLLCNGVKDHVILSLILSAQLLGQRVLPIIEKYTEFEQLMTLADRANQVPRLAVRVKLATRGAGRWFESGGERSKFGLTVPELVRLVRELERRGMQDRLELLHFHLGSQITEIQVLKRAIKEVTQVYADLHQRGVPVRCLDVGGGLGVHYGGGYGVRRFGDQLQPAGVRERRRVLGAGNLRVARRARAGADFGERPGDHRAPLRARCTGARRSTVTTRRAERTVVRKSRRRARAADARGARRGAQRGRQRRRTARGVSRRAGSARRSRYGVPARLSRCSNNSPRSKRCIGARVARSWTA